ncbi:relaxase/mobilization nuclease domain-containing protein [Flavobacterium araucananum]|uniref:MobA/VirD2-like nuclease domain-containing protein n=1 Tax=Flavobacterium araucananum TaxID=946678 RepID=A0A227P2Q9_9FLAO|nr:hypothetical protein [Flavobacterium araucananum]OXG03694.1 hypothetical protein B0A64_17065 [Flavobacterium araucananum]
MGNTSSNVGIEFIERFFSSDFFKSCPYLPLLFIAGHAHLHVVSVNIQKDGKRIDLHHLGIRKSEPARKEIEERFGLVKAEGQKRKKYLL